MKRNAPVVMIALSFGFAFAVGGFGYQSPLETRTIPEEYAVYSAVISHGFKPPKDGRPLVISREVPAYDITQLAKDQLRKLIASIPEMSSENVEDYATRNKTSLTLERLFDLKTKYLLLGKGDKAPPEVVQSLGGIEVVVKISLSPVGFNANKTQALVATGYFCGMLCGEGNAYALRKNKETWEVVGSILLWEV